MSNHHHLRRITTNDEIVHTNYLSEDIGALYLNDAYSDIILNVDGFKINAHKVILASRSHYFRALLYGGLKESQQTEIEMKGPSIEAFKSLLRYIYRGHLSLANQKEEVILDILGLSHQYGFVELEASIADYLTDIVQVRNVCLIYDAARLYEIRFLNKVCCSYMDRHASDILRHETFLQLSSEALKEILQRDSLYAPEVDIFRAVAEWVAANPNEDIQSVIELVRLPLISLSDLLTVVRPSGLITPVAILDAIQARSETKDSELKYRGCLILDENIAHPKHGTQVLQGEMRASILDGDCLNYDMERGYTRHPISDSGDGNGIIIKLGMQAIINHIKMLLWDRDQRSYCYYIEVSMDQVDWVRIIEHTRYFCRSWQYLYFEPRVVKYIRIVGTNNTVNKVFHVVSLEAMYTKHKVKIDKGLVVPIENVATIDKSATVIEGVSRSRNALLNGDTKNYDWDSGYTCHQIGSGAILVQLGQPYMIGSMRLLLWDCDDRSYSYYVEVSVNSWDWELIADRTGESCKSWQTLRFEPRPVVFIRITGVHNSANEVFHCVHFECPAEIEEAQKVPNEMTENHNSDSSTNINTPLPFIDIPTTN